MTNSYQHALGAFLQKFYTLEKEKERILTQYKKYLEAIKRRRVTK